VDRVGVIKVQIDQASAKVRDSGLKVKKEDYEDTEKTGRLWTGVIPLLPQKFSTPQPSPLAKNIPLPEYVTRRLT